MKELQIKKISIDQINPAKYNPRKDLQPSDKEYQKLKQSILEFGYVDPLVWNERNGVLISGHQRLKILKELGYQEVQVSVVNLDEQREKALNLAMNKISGEFDQELLTSLLEELDDDVLSLTGFEEKEIEKLLGQQESPQIMEELQDIEETGFDYECPRCGHQWSGQPK